MKSRTLEVVAPAWSYKLHAQKTCKTLRLVPVEPSDRWIDYIIEPVESLLEE
jgi:hypothetical protein